MTKPKLTKAQEKRFDEKFVFEAWGYKRLKLGKGLWKPEVVKQHLAKELNIQRKELLKKKNGSWDMITVVNNKQEGEVRIYLERDIGNSGGGGEGIRNATG